MAENKTYRHSVTGLVGTYTPELALTFADVLVEVDADAKPLAFQPIPAEAVAEVKATSKEKAK